MGIKKSATTSMEKDITENGIINTKYDIPKVELPKSEQVTKNAEYLKWVYAGPTLPNGILQSNAILNGTFDSIAEFYSDIIEKCPQISNLIVPVHKLSETALKVRTPDNLLYKYYHDVVSTMNNA